MQKLHECILWLNIGAWFVFRAFPYDKVEYALHILCVLYFVSWVLLLGVSWCQTRHFKSAFKRNRNELVYLGVCAILSTIIFVARDLLVRFIVPID